MYGTVKPPSNHSPEKQPSASSDSHRPNTNCNDSFQRHNNHSKAMENRTSSSFSKFGAANSFSVHDRPNHLPYASDAIQLSNYNQLTKLKRLVIIVRAEKDDMSMLISIVNACPRLEEFVFKLIWYKGTRSKRTTRMAGRYVSSLKSKSLKVFEFVGYQSHTTDDKLISCVVENCVSLEKIIIDPRDVLFLIGRAIHASSYEEEARSNALQQFDSLRKSIPAHIQLALH